MNILNIEVPLIAATVFPVCIKDACNNECRADRLDQTAGSGK
jgi:hypothetical protein